MIPKYTSSEIRIYTVGKGEAFVDYGFGGILQGFSFLILSNVAFSLSFYASMWVVLQDFRRKDEKIVHLKGLNT